MHIELGVETESGSPGMMQDSIRLSLSEPETVGLSPTNGMDASSSSDPTLNGVETESGSPGMMQDSIRLSLSEPETVGLSPTNGMDASSSSDPTLNGVETESGSPGMMQDSIRLSLTEPETVGLSPTNGMDASSSSDPTLNDIATTLPCVLMETPSPITEELPFPIAPELPVKKCQNAAMSLKVQDNTESDWDTDSDSLDIYVRRPLTKEEIRVRKRNSFLKFAFYLLFGGLIVLVLCLFLVKWVHEFSKKKEDELIMICLLFLSLALWSLFFLCMFQFLVICPTNCEFADDDVV